jgi:cold-inducible RNA-binding protein
MMNIFIRNLDREATEDQLRAVTEAYGKVESVTIVKDRDTGQARGFAFIEMTSAEEARAAISALDGELLNDRPLRVNEARQKLLHNLDSVSAGTRGHRRHQV